MEVYSELQKILINVLSGGVGGTAFAWIINNIFKERIKEKIKSIYEKELKDYQSKIDLKIKDIEHEHQMHQLKTSLFFDHQRQAFSEILEQISITIDAWWPYLIPRNLLQIQFPKKSILSLKTCSINISYFLIRNV